MGRHLLCPGPRWKFAHLRLIRLTASKALGCVGRQIGQPVLRLLPLNRRVDAYHGIAELVEELVEAEHFLVRLGVFQVGGIKALGFPVLLMKLSTLRSFSCRPVVTSRRWVIYEGRVAWSFDALPEVFSRKP